MERVSSGVTESVGRQRRSGKRVYASRSPRPAWPVRGLWESATDEQRQKAHRACTGILELWLGRKTAAQVGTELGVGAVRVWQLSQSGLSGMLAGLLKQPRWRGRIEMVGMEGGREELLRLRKQVKEQEAKIKAAEALIALLRGMPANRAPTKPEMQPATPAGTGQAERPSGGKKRGRRARQPGAASRGDGLAANDGAGTRAAEVGGGATGPESAHAAGVDPA